VAVEVDHIARCIRLDAVAAAALTPAFSQEREEQP
jgi:hypothetical protein